MQHLLVVDPQATARTFPIVQSDDDEGPFACTDIAFSRAGISGIVSKINRCTFSAEGKDVGLPHIEFEARGSRTGGRSGGSLVGSM